MAHQAEIDLRHISRSQTCSSGKMVFPGRGAARLFLKRQGFPGLRPYRCPECDEIHVGHLPTAVRAGERTASEHYNA
jgi:hypothetical protein